MFIYCICTQYLVGDPFALITASIRCGMAVISLWHCWGGMEAQVSLTVAFSSSAFFGLLFLIFLSTILNSWPQIITDCGNLTLDFKQLELWASPPDSRALVSKWNAELALIWKEDFGPLGNSPVLLLLSPGKTPLMITVAKFLDTSVCGGSWCLDPSLSPFLVKFTQILDSILLDNPLLFLPQFYLPLNFLLTCLDTALCEQPASLAMNVCGLLSLWRVSMIVFWITVRSAVFPMIV